jgi:hypothetical protein
VFSGKVGAEMTLAPPSRKTAVLSEPHESGLRAKPQKTLSISRARSGWLIDQQRCRK